jgi:acetolactate synthase-1/2/3 large subunit
VTLRTGASRIVDALQAGGVHCVFGLPGTQTLELFEALRQSGMRTVVATNELSAAFMAGGWARITGIPGVLVTISGPGFTWALTAVAEARLDSVPLLHIAGSPPKDAVERSFRQQEIDQKAIAAPLVKEVVDADGYDDPALAIFDALRSAGSGVPGPVLVEVTATTLGRDFEPRKRIDSIVANGGSAAIEAVRLRLGSARRPVLVVGRGVNRYAEQLRVLAEALHAPVITTPSARGALPEDHPLNLGFDSFGGSVSGLNELLRSADIVIAIGCKLSHSDTSGFELNLPQDRLVHVAASADVIELNYPVSLGVVGDAGEVLRGLMGCQPTRSSWTVEELHEWRPRVMPRRAHAIEPRVGGTFEASAVAFFRALRSALPTDAVLVLDSGLHQVLARRHYIVLAAHGLIMPTDLQSMGFAIPTAIGAKLAAPERCVVALLGDGGFAMTALELLSAVREGIHLVVIVFADGAFGQIRAQQLASYGSTHGVDLTNPDFGLLAASVGARYESVGETDRIEDVVRRSLASAGVTVIEVGVRDAFPMRRVAATARAREATRRAAGPRLVQLLTKLFRRSG